jgi:Tfp pilus assembly protein PilN
MALPPSALEQLSRRRDRSPGWFSQMLLFSGSIFAISIVVYAGLVFGYKPYINRQVAALDGQIQRFSQEIPDVDQDKIISFYSQLINLRTLLDEHVLLSPFFTWLEEHTIVGAYYTKFSLNTLTRQMSLGGVARTLEDVASQLAALQDAPGVQSVTFNNVSVDARGSWQFDFTVSLAPSLFTSAPQPTP